MTNQKKQYGYWDNVAGDDSVISGRVGQCVSGFGLGILALDVAYPLIPGNVVNAYTYDFPVRVKCIKGATTERIFRNDKTLLDEFIEAGRELEAEGCRAISGACGYFANYQKELAENLDVPVFASSLLQAPWIRSSLKRNQKIGVICAKSDSVTNVMLESVGIDDSSYLVVKGLENTAHFGPLVDGSVIEFKNSGVRQDVVQTAIELATENNLGAILLECSDLPPYSAYIQRAVGLPVFDYITLHKWIQSAIMQKPYHGFI
jgi:Asp/Glu/Hydantoin racemase.